MFSNESIKQAFQALQQNGGKFSSECFNILCQESSTPQNLFNVFKKFILNILNSEEVDKNVAIGTTHNAIRNSPNLLDSFLTALFEWNNQQFNVTNVFHNYLNEEFVKKDWSHLSSPSVLSIQNLPKKDVSQKLLHPIDMCINELIFSHSSPEGIANSLFVNIPIDSTFDLLSEKAQNNFTDALLIKYRDNVEQLFNLLEQNLKRSTMNNDKLLNSLFRERDDYSLFIQTFSFNDDNINAFIPKICFVYDHLKSLKNNNNYFPFFSFIILPYADHFSDNFIQSVINCQKFPSSNPNFPTELLLKSENCCKKMTIKVLFDIFKEGELNEFVLNFQNAYNNIIPVGHKNAEEFRAETILKYIFSSSAEKRPFICEIFLWYIQKFENITSDMVSQCIASFLPQYCESICALTKAAIDFGTNLKLFLNNTTILAFLDFAFINPKPTLDVILEMSMKYPQDDSVRRFWLENTSLIIDTITQNHPLTSEFSRFLLDFIRSGQPDFIKEIFRTFADDYDFDYSGNHTDDPALQLFNQFLNIC